MRSSITLILILLFQISWSQSETELYSYGTVVPNVGPSANPPKSGMIRFNTSTQDFEGYDGALWKSLTGLPSTPPNPQYNIGDYAEGGVVFWVSPDGMQGKVVSILSLNPSIWRSPPTFTQAQSNSNGLSNSEIIVSRADHTGSAAQRCLDLVENGYDDWYLPAKDEILELLHQTLVVNPTITQWFGDPLDNTWYWSSTGELGQNAYVGKNQDPIEAEAIGQVFTAGVRAIRNFTITP